MTKQEIKGRIEELKRIKREKFLTIDDLTDGFYNGQILVYERWISSL